MGVGWTDGWTDGRMIIGNTDIGYWKLKGLETWISEDQNIGNAEDGVYGKSLDDRGVCKWFGFSELRRIGAMARKPIGGGSEHREVRWTCRMTLDRLDKGRMDESGHVPMMCNAMKAARVWMTARDGGNCSVMGRSKYIPDGTQAEEGEVNTQAESLSPLLGEVSKHQWRKNGHRVPAGASDFRTKLDMSHKKERKI
ncbi:hypothetical protein C8R48DRAFT_672420 [Suillus tomentosus]|nr:hypothetical protein C8R48DRAFT_672420 [Suillus tomentosus]